MNDQDGVISGKGSGAVAEEQQHPFDPTDAEETSVTWTTDVGGDEAQLVARAERVSRKTVR